MKRQANKKGTGLRIPRTLLSKLWIIADGIGQPWTGPKLANAVLYEFIEHVMSPKDKRQKSRVFAQVDASLDINPAIFEKLRSNSPKPDPDQVVSVIRDETIGSGHGSKGAAP